MRAFNYSCPTDLAEAVKLLRAEPDAKLVAGGQTLLASLKLRLAAPSRLVDLRLVPKLQTISGNDKEIEIGAMSSHADVAVSPIVAARIPALAQLAGGIGDRMVRNMGTLGGSIANNDPAADYPAAVLALNAGIITTTRCIPAAEFFLGMFETALQPDEIVVAVRFPVPRRAAYVKFRHPASRFALTGVFVAETAEGSRVVVTGAGPNVFRVPAMESALDRDFSPAALTGITVAAAELSTDLHASAEYRANLIRVLAERAVAAALGEAPIYNPDGQHRSQ